MAKIKNNQTFTGNITLSGSTNTVDNALDLNGDVTLGAAATFDAGANPLTNLADPSLAQDAVTVNYADTTYVGLTGDQTIAGVKTFSSIPGSGGTPAQSTDLITKGYADSNYAELTQATVQTTDATPTTLASIAISASSVVEVTAWIAAASADYSDACGGSVTAVVRRGAAGNAALVNTSFDVTIPDSTATFDVVLSTNNLLVQVTGIAATTYNWKARYFTVVN